MHKKAKPEGATGAVRNRIRELRQVRAADLVANPLNWRQHGEQQKAAMSGILAEVGIVDALLVTDNGDGTYAIVDGHMRAGLLPDAELPCLVLDLTPEEATKVLLTFDPIAAMADASAANLDALLRQVEFGEAALQELVSGLAEQSGVVSAATGEDSALKPLSVQPPPPMTWVLIGVPTVKFGAISEAVEQVAGQPDTFVEITSNGNQN
jgi:hypothetical protein